MYPLTENPLLPPSPFSPFLLVALSGLIAPWGIIPFPQPKKDHIIAGTPQHERVVVLAGDAVAITNLRRIDKVAPLRFPVRMTYFCFQHGMNLLSLQVLLFKAMHRAKSVPMDCFTLVPRERDFCP